MAEGGWLEADSELFARLGEVFTPDRGEISGSEADYRISPQKERNTYEHPDPMDKPSGTGAVEQLRWLEEAGFESMDVPWTRAGHAVFCAYKPANGSDSQREL